MLWTRVNSREHKAVTQDYEKPWIGVVKAAPGDWTIMSGRQAGKSWSAALARGDNPNGVPNLETVPTGGLSWWISRVGANVLSALLAGVAPDDLEPRERAALAVGMGAMGTYSGMKDQVPISTARAVGFKIEGDVVVMTERGGGDKQIVGHVWRARDKVSRLDLWALRVALARCGIEL